MKKSIGLLSALVVSTTFIVNCQKAPDKRRVRPSGGTGAAQSDVVTEKAKLPTKVCSKEIIEAYTKIYNNQGLLAKMVITADSSDADKEAKRKLGIETLDNCEEVVNLLKAEPNEGCYRDNGVKDLSNAYMASSVHSACKGLAKKLETEVQLESQLANEAKADDKAKADAKQVESELIGKELRMSKDARQLVLAKNTNGGKFLVEGEIQSSTSSLNQALAASSTVCTFTGEGLEIDENVDATLKITQASAAEKADLESLKEDFTGKATVLTTEISQAEKESELIGLLCLNLDVTKLSVEKITKALGTGIASAPVQVATEVTGGTSEAAVVSTQGADAAASATASATTFTAADLTAAQPAGSPQAQHLASGTAQMIAEANQITGQKVEQQQAAASSTVVASGTAQVEVVVTAKPTDAASQPAQVQQDDADAKAKEVARLKEKAERLEKDAKDAEEEVKKLEAAKAKAEDIDEAKARARNIRETANTAKAEYEAAARSVVVAGNEF